MKIFRNLLIAGSLPCLLMMSCNVQEKLSRKYYLSKKTDLKQINEAYDKLYKINPFILNFTDAQFKKYSVEVSTDTVRYVYNTSIMNFSVADSLKRFGLTITDLKKLGEQMFRSKCICVAKHSFYLEEKEYPANWLYFKQSKSGMFKESRYHVLIFFQKGLTDSNRKTFLEKQKLMQLDKDVFYTISNRFK